MKFAVLEQNGARQTLRRRMAHKTNTAGVVREIAQPLAQSMGLTLWDVVFVKEGPSWYLRVFIDKPGGIFIDDCENFSRALDPKIDELDLVGQEYCFEVSSPGLGRILRTNDHLEAYKNKDVRIKLYRERDDGRKEIFGVLKEYDTKHITLDIDDRSLMFSREAVSEIRADDDRDLFDFGGNK